MLYDHKLRRTLLRLPPAGNHYAHFMHEGTRRKEGYRRGALCLVESTVWRGHQNPTGCRLPSGVFVRSTGCVLTSALLIKAHRKSQATFRSCGFPRSSSKLWASVIKVTTVLHKSQMMRWVLQFEVL